MKSLEFTSASIEKAIAAIRNHGDEFEAIRRSSTNLALDEIAQLYLVEKLGFAQIEAEDVVCDLNRGLAMFDEQFGKNASSGKINVMECLEKATENNTDEE